MTFDMDGALPSDDEAMGKIVDTSKPVEIRAFTDIPKIRKGILNGVREAFQTKTVENKNHVLDFQDVHYSKPKEFSLKEEKEAILNRRRVYWNLHGRLRVRDKATGAVVSEDAAPRKLAEVPYLSRRGTAIHNGTEYLTFHQARLRPGAYTRQQANGDVETQFNVPGGRGFRVHMTEKTGVFRIQAGQAKMKMYPVLSALGVSDQDLVKAWGKDLFNANKAADDKTPGVTLVKLVGKLGRHADQDLSVSDAMKRLPEILAELRVDPGVQVRALGPQENHGRVTPNTILAATRKILDVHKSGEPDVRDAMTYQSFHGPEDHFREHVEHDAGGYLRQALWKAGFKKSTAAVPDGYFTKQLQSVLLSSGLSAPLSEINPAEIYDARHKITRMGESGLSSTDMVPEHTRGVQPTHFGFIDPIRSPESSLIALDLRAAQGVSFGSDGRLYRDVIDTKTGKKAQVSSDDVADHIVAFPGEMARPGKKVRAMVNGDVRYVKKSQVEFELPHFSSMSTPLTSLIPGLQGIKGQRGSMGARMQTQALALKNAEAPLVTVTDPHTGRYRGLDIGADMGAVFADHHGVVTKVTPEAIHVMGPHGETVHELYDHFPLNQKSFLHSTALVNPGQTITKGMPLAKSNFTDARGHMAMGKNLLAAFHMMDGLTHEDAVVLSDTASNELSSETMYEHSKEHGEGIHEISKSAHQAKYGGAFTMAQISGIDGDGVVRPGTILNKGDPIILAVGRRTPGVKGSIAKSSKSEFSDASEIWDHGTPGEVVDVRKTPKGYVVTTKSYAPTKVADKVSGCFGNKGVVADIRPDAEMPKTSDGETIHIAMNPVGVTSRINPAQLAEASLARITRKYGTRYDLGKIPGDSIVNYAWSELQKHGMMDTDTITDKNGRKVPEVYVGVPYIMKLHHMAEDKMGARNTAHYTSEGLPARGSSTGSKRFGNMELAAAVAHGVPHFLEDFKLTRGQRNDEYWQMYRMGLNPPAPKVSRMYEKFEASLQGAGVHLRKTDSRTQIVPGTKQDIDRLSGSREITVPDTVDFDHGDPVKDGLFDIGLTGGKDGIHWSHIKLPEALPNPVMEDPLRSILGLTKDAYREVIAGRGELNGIRGPEALQHALEAIDVDRDVASTLEAVKTGRRSSRDAAVKKLGYLQALQRSGIHPKDLLLDKVPVVPPKFRPITKFQGMTMSADMNYLYKELMEAAANHKKSMETFGDAGDTRLQTYDAFKAVSGLGDPIGVENQERGARGLLKQIIGASPKSGMFQRKVLGNPVDFAGRAVIVPDVDLDIDEIGMPVDMMWTQFKPFIIRRMVRNGMPALQAIQEHSKRSSRATEAMLHEAAERPVVINRAPTLHKGNLTGHYAKPVAGHALRVSNLILKGHAGDYDGDALNVHVPVSQAAVDDVRERMLPSKQLYHPGTFDVHMLPPQGYLTGLYVGSQSSNKSPRTFENPAAVARAYRSGEISASDPVVVLHSH